MARPCLSRSAAQRPTTDHRTEPDPTNPADATAPYPASELPQPPLAGRADLFSLGCVLYHLSGVLEAVAAFVAAEGKFAA